MINGVLDFSYFGDIFTDNVVTVFVSCTAFPGDHLSGCHRGFDAGGLTAAPKALDEHVLASPLRADSANMRPTTSGEMVI